MYEELMDRIFDRQAMNMNTLTVAGVITKVDHGKRRCGWVTNVIFKHQLGDTRDSQARSHDTFFRISYFDEDALSTVFLFKEGDWIKVTGRVIPPTEGSSILNVMDFEVRTHCDKHGGLLSTCPLPTNHTLETCSAEDIKSDMQYAVYIDRERSIAAWQKQIACLTAIDTSSMTPKEMLAYVRRQEMLSRGMDPV